MGAACRITKIGRLNHSTVWESPIQTPKPTPTIPQMTKPITSGWRVDRYALARLPSAVIRMSAMNVWLNGGKAALSGQRPTASQRPNAKANDKEQPEQTPIPGPFGIRHGCLHARRSASRNALNVSLPGC